MFNESEDGLDGLMDQLNSGGESVPPGTPNLEGGTPVNEAEGKALAKANADAKADPLLVTPQAAPTPMEKLKAKAAAVKANGYAITVEGKYTVKSAEHAGKKVEKIYNITVNLPKLEGALSVIKNRLLDKMLKAKYPGYCAYLTHVIVDAKPLTANTPAVNSLAYMTEEDLKLYIERRDVPVDPANYAGDVKALRAAVVDFVLNPVDFDKREALRVKDLKEQKELEALNPETLGAATE